MVALVRAILAIIIHWNKYHQSNKRAYHKEFNTAEQAHKSKVKNIILKKIRKPFQCVQRIVDGHSFPYPYKNIMSVIS